MMCNGAKIYFSTKWFLQLLEVATPTCFPFSGRGCHALTWRSHGHSLAAYLWRHLRQTVLKYPVRGLSGVHLPGKSTEMTSQS